MFRAIRNEGQNADNLFKLYEATDGCCGDTTAACQYSVLLPTANAVNNIIITNRLGVAETITTGFPATGAANVVAAIKAALVSAGYEDDTDAAPGVSYETILTDTLYRITGNVVVVSMKHNGATTVAATALCTRIKKCQYTLAWAGNAAATDFVINGVTASLAALTYAGKTAAEVRTAIIGLANWPTTATIEVVKANSLFTITITDVFTATYTLDSVDFESGNCGMGYTA